MSYYAGYHGVACYLSIEDFEDFMKSYFKLHPDLTEEEREDLDPAEYAFKKVMEVVILAFLKSLRIVRME